MMRVFLIAALTADGFIARSADHVADWTSLEDKKLFVQLTKEAGVMVMGASTFKTIGRALPGRRTIVYTRGSLDFEAVEITQESPAELIARLEQEGCTQLAVCGGASIYHLFLEAGVVNELYLTVEPVMFGHGVSLAGAPLDISLRLLEQKLLNASTILLHYEVQK